MSNSEYVHDLGTWLREVKGITKIDVFELVEYYQEFDEYRASLGEFNKVEESDFEG